MLKVIGIIMFIVGTYLFIMRFIPGKEMSDFATYGGFILGIIGLFFTLYTTFQNRKHQYLLNSPEIDFTLNERAEHWASRYFDSVKIFNKTESPAENILIRYRQLDLLPYSKWVLCFSLSAHEKIELFWLRYPDAIQAAYHDRNKKRYFLSTKHDSLCNTISITQKEYVKIVEEGKANRNFNDSRLRVNFENFLNRKMAQFNNDFGRVEKDFTEFYDSNLKK
ncbi:hypothetical protein [Chitinophaga sp. LS1]|uniref:hypothetical protein n=1 Tax=Chitinophaga sp. LS1 TaxID=3051176 RepID=UPI002AAC4B2E|nr:hypothetical protein [Chitinophaga sp. LS1]WPV65406.1 hypothetical protein QQL36_26755 [Chitinophaga sp. LS1]